MNILIVYASKEGQTEKIADHMSEIFRRKSHQVTTLSAKGLPDAFATEAFDASIVGGSIHMGKYPGYLKQFVSAHQEWLNSIPSAFFTVCMGINSQQEKSKEVASHYGDHFIEQTDWHPHLIATFAGAVKYTQYDVMTRLIMKWISRKEGGSTDTSHDHEYTNWNAVDRFTDQFLQQADNRETA